MQNEVGEYQAQWGQEPLCPTVCRADGLQEAREKAASIAKVILQIFIVFIF